MRPNQRLRRRADFEYIRAKGRRVSNALLIMGLAPASGAQTRFGLAVGKRVGNAVVRNRVKRRLRESIQSLAIRDGWSVVVTARPQAASAGYWRLRAAVESLARRSGLRAEPKDERER